MRHRVTRSPAGSSRPRAGWRGSLVLAVVALVTLAGAASPAAAHDTLVGAEPADGTALTTAPGQVVLTFSADQLALGAAVAVTGPDGASVTSGDPVVAGTTLTQALSTGLAAGAYSVQWRSVSGDGHPIEGIFGFTVEASPSPTPSETASAAPTPSAPPTAQTEPSAGPVVSTPGPGATTEAPRANARSWLVAGLVVLVVAGAAIAVVVRRQGLPE